MDSWCSPVVETGIPLYAVCVDRYKYFCIEWEPSNWIVVIHYGIGFSGRNVACSNVEKIVEERMKIGNHFWKQKKERVADWAELNISTKGLRFKWMIINT